MLDKKWGVEEVGMQLVQLVEVSEQVRQGESQGWQMPDLLTKGSGQEVRQVLLKSTRVLEQDVQELGEPTQVRQVEAHPSQTFVEVLATVISAGQELRHIF